MSTRIRSRLLPQVVYLQKVAPLAQILFSRCQNLTSHGHLQIVALFCLFPRIALNHLSSPILSVNPGFAVAFIFPIGQVGFAKEKGKRKKEKGKGTERRPVPRKKEKGKRTERRLVLDVTKEKGLNAS
jgi:hypothetical protein